jgi:c-di-GMP-binding flagellar brake protein YcgR
VRKVSDTIESSAEAQERERRSKLRFHIEQEVRYKVLCGQRNGEMMTGKTANISSGGVWIATGAALSTGTPLEISITWPVLLNDSCPMKLVIYGCVVRSNEGGVAAAIERYEFRTQRRPVPLGLDDPAGKALSHRTV